MRLGKDLTGKPIISINDGRHLGNVKDLYVNNDLYWLTGIHVGQEGLLKRKALVIHRDHVVVFGIDAILVKNADVITNAKELVESIDWQRLDKLRGRDVDTPGGTKVGTIGDIVLGEEGHISGFSLSKIFVEGPIAEKGFIHREALIDTGQNDGKMTIDLPKVEQLYQNPPEKTESSSEPESPEND
ncbi:MAG: PRC-barrel domain-containing protein [Anaerolineae bacterium]